MGNHGAASAGPRTSAADKPAQKSTAFGVPNSWTLRLQNWPVSWRLIAVIVLALIMGLVFGGLRITAAAGSAAQFGRVSQLADLGEQTTVLVQDLQSERDKTLGVIAGGNLNDLNPLYDVTDAEAARVQALAAGIGGSFPANIQASVAAVLSQTSTKGLTTLRNTAKGQGSDVLGVIADYATPIGEMITLNDEIAQGTSDSSLANDVRTLNSLSLAKDAAAQQRALLYNAFTQQFFGDGVVQALTAVQSEEFADEAAFQSTATPAEQSAFANTVNGPGVNEAEVIEDFFFIDGGDQQPLNTSTINPSTIGFTLSNAPTVWYRAMSSKLDEMQTVEQQIAGNIVSRAQSLEQGAQQSALITTIITAIVLFLVLAAAVLVARSLVLPLRRLRAGALDIATVQLPERVRQLGETPDSATSLEVAPIDVMSTDEVGQVARAFDQVHSEAVRLAGNEALLRRSFNAMFVSLSRRSQSLIERLARMIDSLEQNEEDPDRLSNLFSMDHLVTRMRRNSENLLLLAGHEGARKWSEPLALTDVARAATSEIEQYNRVTLKIQPGISISGQAVSDVAHLLAEVIENATVFSPKDTQVQVSARELATGGVLIEVSDSGVGVSEARLAEMNWRLDSVPVLDESVSRHMGLFAVARLAERHGIRVRLRAGSPRGLTALVWLPDSLAEHGASWYGRWTPPIAAQAEPAIRRSPGRHSIAAHPTAEDEPVNGRSGAHAALASPGTGPREEVPAAGSASADWFRDRQLSGTDAAGNGSANGGAPEATTPLKAVPQADVPQAGNGGLPGTDGWAEGRQAAQIIADPVRGDHTAAGLPTRVPQANLIPGSAGGGRQAGSRAPDGHVTQTHGPARQRSPEHARSRLSGFQRGARRAQGQTSRKEEGADR
jgi:signal transduction histidine kinase